MLEINSPVVISVCNFQTFITGYALLKPLSSSPSSPSLIKTFILADSLSVFS